MIHRVRLTGIVGWIDSPCVVKRVVRPILSLKIFFLAFEVKTSPEVH